jgi:hypothetical protein
MEIAEVRPRSTTSGSTRRFIRHYVEMVVAMFVGMVVLGVSVDAVLDVPDRPAVLLAEMAITMILPMVAWMRFRGHCWRACSEMTAAMLVPTLGALALLAAGLVTDADTLLMLEHTAMLPSMLAAMLLRRYEYTAQRHGRREQVAT